MKLSEVHQDGSQKMFAAFNLYPRNVNFETKDKEEKIILMLRQHPIVNLGWILMAVLLFFTPFILERLGVLTYLPSGYPLIVKMVFFLVTFIYAVEGFFRWYFNVFFITTKRVMDVDFFNLIDRKVTFAEIGNIQDVTYMTSGAIGTVFNFGNVLIQTASEIPELIFERVPSPERVANVLDDLRTDKH
jgi:uncharacterized membrane protein YdbT with pleckstrin-like domain